MSIIPSFPFVLTNGTTADATQVMADFNQIFSSVNANAAENGTNASITTMTGLTSVSSAVNFSGAATAVTQSASDNSTKLATTAFVQAVLQVVYPVGALYTSTLSTNPNSLLGFGTWVAYAAGRTLVGVGTGTDINSNTLVVTGGGTGGEYTHILTTPEMPSHTHYDYGHQHLFTAWYFGPGSSGAPGGANLGQGTTNTTTGYANLQNTGGGGAHNNTQPYIGVYIWQRTA